MIHISIKESVREDLKSFKEHTRETYGDVVERLVKEHKDNQPKKLETTPISHLATP